MPRMQKPNVSEMNNYIVCNKRRSCPRIHYKICELCRYSKQCVNFKSFKNMRPDLYPLLEIKKKRFKSKKKK